MDQMAPEQAMQQLAMALLELGIDPQQLAAAASETGQKMAAAVQSFKQSGAFRFEEAKTPLQKSAREYMKGYVRELLTRSRR